jgi:hypothetical protein
MTPSTQLAFPQPFWEFSVFHLHVVGSFDQRGGSRRDHLAAIPAAVA